MFFFSLVLVWEWRNQWDDYVLVFLVFFLQYFIDKEGFQRRLSEEYRRRGYILGNISYGVAAKSKMCMVVQTSALGPLGCVQLLCKALSIF